VINRGTVLVVGAHCDDETFGCGGLMVELVRRGCRVVSLVMSYPDWDRKMGDLIRSEWACAGLTLGFERREAQFETLRLNECVPKMADCIKSLIAKERADYVFTQAGSDTHQDHRAVNCATLIACGVESGVKMVAEYEVPLSSVKMSAFEPNAYVEIDIEKKLEGYAMYKSQHKEGAHPRNSEVVRALARVRGSECGCAYAEAFKIVRCML
jgi:LmbE family N-acetylglucosaminyl deacetylase